MEHHWNEDDDTWFEGIIAADDGDLSQWEFLTRTFDNPSFLPEQPLHNDEVAMDVEHASSLENALSEYNPLPYRRHSAGHGVSEAMDTDDDLLATLRRTWPGTMPGTSFAQRKSFERRDASPISFDRQLHLQEAHLHHNDRFAGRSRRDDAAMQQERDSIQQASVSMRHTNVARLRQASDGESTSGSSCGKYSTYPPTPDNASIPDSSPQQLQDAFQYVFTPRISELLHSDAFSNQGPSRSGEKTSAANARSGSRSLSPGTSTAGNNDGVGNSRLSRFSHIGEVDESKPPPARDLGNDADSTDQPSSNEPLAIMCPPLTAYNYFYRSERNTIVEGMTHADDPLPPVDWNFTPAKKAELLHHHWYVVAMLCSGVPNDGCMISIQANRFPLSFPVHLQECGSVQKETQTSKVTWVHRVYIVRTCFSRPQCDCELSSHHLTSGWVVIITGFPR
jgi:hypothetical protein